MNLFPFLPLLAAALLMRVHMVRPFRSPAYGTALFALGALTGVLASLN